MMNQANAKVHLAIRYSSRYQITFTEKN